MIDDNFMNEIIYAIAPYVENRDLSDIRMRLAITLSKYDVKKQETELIPYEGDVNIEILKRFLMAKTARGLSKRTLELYKNSISMTLAKIGKPYSQVTADDIRLYLAIRVNRDGVSKTCANNERRNLSAFYTWLQKEEILIKNPMAKVEPIKETKKKKKAYTNMDLEKIRYACEDEMDRALVEVLISTWARISEIASIKISDIDGNKIIVHGKGDKYRMVYLTAKAQLAIKAYLEKRNDDAPLLFPKGRPAKELIKSGIKTKDLHLWWTSPENISDGERDPGSLESRIRKIGKRAGVENVHPHRFRRTGATMALRAGMPLMEVSQILGHESVGTTQIYLDIDNQQLESTHEKYVI